MSESAEPSTSRTAMAIAFKRARRKFPKNFGLTFNSEEAYQTSENEEFSLSLNNTREPPLNYQTYEKTISDQAEESLVDSLQEVEISDKAETLCDQCQLHNENLENVDQEDGSVSKASKFEINYDYEKSLPDDSCDSNNSRQSLSKTSQPNYTFHGTRRSYSLNGTEESDQCDNANNVKERETLSIKNDWKPRDQINVAETEFNVGEALQMPQMFHERRETSFRRKKHRCKKSSESYIRHPCSLFALSDNIFCNNDVLTHSPDCFYYNHCSHYHHCHQSCCCRSYCCCSRCYLNCANRRDHCSSSANMQEPLICQRRTSTAHRRFKRDKCTTCKRRSSGSGISSRQPDTCSRDSGIFTNVRYENADYDEDEVRGSPRNILLRRDSFTILQEYANKRRDEGQYMVAEVAANDEEDYYEALRGQNLLRNF